MNYCPTCGYYCTGNGGVGCIDKPGFLAEESSELTPKMIADAPEPLEALKELIGILGPNGYFPSAGKPLTDKCRAAIA